jgi:hypothetical protein
MFAQVHGMYYLSHIITSLSESDQYCAYKKCLHTVNIKSMIRLSPFPRALALAEATIARNTRICVCMGGGGVGRPKRLKFVLELYNYPGPGHFINYSYIIPKSPHKYIHCHTMSCHPSSPHTHYTYSPSV